jgi:hypothetical protein
MKVENIRIACGSASLNGCVSVIHFWRFLASVTT